MRDIVVLGNGPSLAGVDFPALRSSTIGMNSAYRYWREIDWRPTFYTCLDTVVGLSHADAIADLVREGRIERFLLRDNLCRKIGPHPRIVNYDKLREADAFHAIDPITTGSHAVLWAASMGYVLIGIAGIDQNYVEIVDGAERAGGNELVIREAGSNPNYFFSGYQQPGDRYNVPNPNPGMHGRAWDRVASRVTLHGAQVFNIAPDSPFSKFPRLSPEHFDRRAMRFVPRYGCEEEYAAA